MAENDKLDVFLCGNYSDASTTDEKKILKIVEDTFNQSGETRVANSDLLRASLTPRNFKERSDLVTATRQAMMKSDFGYCELTVPRIIHFNQIYALRDLFFVPIITVAREGSLGDQS